MTENINCCIIAIQRYEPYIKYWLDYHLKWGFSHIFLLDNNDYGDELKLDGKYSSQVTVLPCNKIENIFDKHHFYQPQLYNGVLDYVRGQNTHYYSYTHCLVIDIDEYFYTPLYDNVNDFIKNHMKEDTLPILWKNYGDGDFIYIKDLPSNNPIESYTKEATNKFNVAIEPKSFAVIDENTTLNVHWHNNKLGENLLSDENIACIKHYRTGCVEEYVMKNKFRRLSTAPYWYNNGESNLMVYFNYNTITNEKLDAFVELYKKYGIEMSEGDKHFVETNRQ